MNKNELIKLCDALSAERRKFPVVSQEEKILTRQIVAACDKAIESGVKNSVALWNHAEANGWRPEWNICLLNA